MSGISEKWRWFERHFTFDFPESKLPDIVERLRGTIIRLTSVVAIEESIRIARIDETWSIQENVGHLLLLEPLWIGRLNDILSGEQRLREADLANQATNEASFNTLAITDVIADFTEHRHRFVSMLNAMPIRAGSHASIHPRLEVPMRAVDLAYFVAEHDDYHFARMSEIQHSI